MYLGLFVGRCACELALRIGRISYIQVDSGRDSWEGDRFCGDQVLLSSSRWLAVLWCCAGRVPTPWLPADLIYSGFVFVESFE